MSEFQRPLILNHAEMVYPVGGKEAARAALEVMGFTVNELGPWFLVIIDASSENYLDNVLYASEVTPAQEKYEAAFAAALEKDQDLAAALTRYKEVRHNHPQYPFHFGFSIPTHEEWKERVERVEEAGRSHPLLAGKIEVAGVFEPGDPDAFITHISQAFVRTEVLATEGLQLGLQIELQWAPVDDKGNPIYGLTDELPDLKKLT
jgi:hypothetical protein